VTRNVLRLWALQCLLVTAGFAPGRAADLPPAPLFTFAIIGDSHISTSTVYDSKYIKANDQSAALLATYVKDINQHVPPVSFVVHLGDITDTAAEEEFDEARGILDDLKAPLYPVVGNHDNFRSDGKQGWKKLTGRDSTTYAFDFRGFHFVVIDCTDDPYEPGGVNADGDLREWVKRDLARNRETPAIVFSHYNMWERSWNSQFDTTRHYKEYEGMGDLREVLKKAGNVVAVINGHVHANRVEVHDGIYYVDVGATLVGRPSVRYFSVYPDRIEADFAYISNGELLDYVLEVSRECASCFDRGKVADYADGSVADKRFTIALRPAAAPAPTSPNSN
jgi:3',5'-cyclic AMP phosphodiesterase CpdA